MLLMPHTLLMPPVAHAGSRNGGEVEGDYGRLDTVGSSGPTNQVSQSGRFCRLMGARSDPGCRAQSSGRPGDVLVVTRLDRLARSTRDLLNILDTVAKADAGFRSLADAWADTTTPHGRLMLTVLGGLAEFERELIRARTGEGRKRARARGVKFGRPPKLNAHQRKEAIARMRNGETQADIARTYGVDATTIGRLDCLPAQ